MNRRHFLKTLAAGTCAPALAWGREPARIVLLLPLSGTQAALGRMLMLTAEAAVAEINRHRLAGKRMIVAQFEDWRSDPLRFDALARTLGSGHDRAASLFGPCPAEVRAGLGFFLEQAGGLLWDPGGYEGGECSVGILHGGPTPHQSLKQLLPFLASEVGPRFLLVGDDQPSSQGMNRVARWAIGRMGASVVGEVSGADEYGPWLGKKRSSRFDVMFCSLQGVALVEFLRVCHAQGVDPAQTPVASPYLTELEARECGPGVAAGQVACQPYFASLKTLGNDVFRRILGRQVIPNAAAEALWGQLHLFAQAIAILDDISPHPVLVREVAKGRDFLLPQGRVRIEADGVHTHLWPKIAVVQADGSFQIIARTDRALEPVPFWGMGEGACAPQLAADPS